MSITEHKHMPEPVRRIEVFTGAGRRRWPGRNRQQRSRARIRLLALNRKNALFAGSDGGAEHWAVIASLIETCKLLNVEPDGSLTDVITRVVNGHSQRRVDEVLPWAYPAALNLKAMA